MCFGINTQAKRWGNKYVYKVVEQRGRSLYSPIMGWKTRYNPPGKTVVRSPGLTRDRYGSTKNGIYVCKTLKDALRYMDKNLPYIGDYHKIIKLKVDPKDFLWAAFRGRSYKNCATYNKVTVTSEIWDVKE